MTTTSDDELSTTKQFDFDGDGTFGRTVTDVTVLSADGSLTTTTTSASGAVIARTVSTRSADGLTRSTQADVDGDGTFDRSRTTATVLNANGSRVETVTNRNGDNSVHDQTVVTTSADGWSRTIQFDADGDSDFDQVATIVVGANGSTVDTLSNFNPNGSLNNRTIVTTSADGLTTTAQLDLNGAMTNSTAVLAPTQCVVEVATTPMYSRAATAADAVYDDYRTTSQVWVESGYSEDEGYWDGKGNWVSTGQHWVDTSH